ncbi:MAG TPA: BatA domain-containing protein [Cyclobacteriaceae bacterium]|nr:BatA domain-containing protein [Cyclobacteriaceae bacterium]
MSFLYPSFLWALAALAIPIIIHLFNFRKTTRVLFSNTRVLKQVKQVTTAKRRLKHLLILLSRLLFLAFLVIAFAQPVIPAREQLAGRRNITLYLDNSLSMSAQLQGRQRALDAGISFAGDIANLFPPDTRYRLITNDFAPSSNTLKAREELIDLLTQVKLSPISRSASEVMNRIHLADREGQEEVFWISDFQRSTFGTPPAPDTAVRWHLVPISPTLNDNVFIDTAYLENPFAIGQELNSLKVKVRNDGNREREQLNLKLTINGIQAATTAVTIPAGGVSEVSFDLATGLTGLNEAHVSFNDQPVSFDNDFYLSLNYTEKIRVLEIKPTSQPTAIQQVFGNRQVFSYSGFPVGNFNYSLLNQADLVVVNGVNPDEALSLALRAFLDDYGTLLFIPGPEGDANAYQTLLGLPVTVQEQGAMQELDAPDFSNPFFENVFEERSVAVAMPRATKYLDWGADRSAILKFKNGSPFLSAYQQGGTLYLLASPLNDTFTDFSKNAIFVPVMYRMASSARKSAVRPYYILSENFVSLKIDSLTGEESLRLKGEQEIIPAQRTVGDRVLVDIPKHTFIQGFYYVTAPEDTISLLAFNLDREESLMATHDTEAVLQLLGGGSNLSVFEAASTEAFSKEIKDRYLGKPLWKYAVLLALIFLLTEILLIRLLK